MKTKKIFYSNDNVMLFVLKSSFSLKEIVKEETAEISEESRNKESGLLL